MKKRRQRMKGGSRVRMMLPHEAAWPSGNRSVIFAPGMVESPRRELGSWARQRLWAKARVLFSNSPEVINLVECIKLVVGYLLPLPQSGDEEWNDLARAAFMRRVERPALFDVGGVFCWRSVQLWANERKWVDGDCLVVRTKHPVDGGAAFAFYEAPQVCGGGEGFEGGVRLGAFGRPEAYVVKGLDGAEVQVSAADAFLYRKQQRPGLVRGLSGLAPVLNTAQDLFELRENNKAAAKLAASFAIIEKQAAQVAGQPFFHEARNPQLAEGDGGSSSSPPPPALKVNGVEALSLPAGRSLELLHDTRPSNEQQAFCKDLVRSFGFAAGLPPEVVFFLSEMGSASTRFSTQRVGDWQKDQLLPQRHLVQWMWEWVVACEVAAGRLRGCRAAGTECDVLWVPRSSWTIDKGRDGNMATNHVREGLVDANDYTVASSGKTVREIARSRAKDLAEMKRIAEEHGLTLADLLPGMVGATTPGPGQVAEQKEKILTEKGADDE